MLFNKLVAVVVLYKRYFLTVGLLSAIINLLMLTPSIYMLQVYDRVLTSNNTMTLYMITIVVMCGFCMIGFFDYSRSMLLISLSEVIGAKFTRRIYHASFLKSLMYGNSYASRGINDLNTIKQFMSSNAVFSFFDIPWFFVYLTVLFLFHIELGFFALFSAFLIIFIAIINELFSKISLKKSSKLYLESNQMLEGQMFNTEVVQSMGMLRGLYLKWFEVYIGFIRYQSLASENIALFGTISKTLRMALQSLALGLGAWLVINNKITPGMMIAGSILLGRVLAPIDMVISTWRQWISIYQAYNRLQDLISLYPAEESSFELSSPNGRISFENVSLADHSTKINILKNINLDIAQGQIVGVIGSSGSGKSSLARLVVGVCPPSQGVIRIDDADILQWDREILGKHIGYLPQDIELIPGTIADNIARFYTNTTNYTGDLASNIIKSAQVVGIHEFILSLPKGYDSYIGPGGINLSGGQKQRIALARALYNQPKIVVLDEPNSNLDEVGERALLEVLKKLKSSGVTVLIVTHRPYVLAATTHIVLMRCGNIVFHKPTDEVVPTNNNNKRSKL